jgi:hypothetical protein
MELQVWLKAFLLAIFFAAEFRGPPYRASLVVLSQDARLSSSSIPTRIRHLSPLKVAQLGALVKERATISSIASHYIDIPVSRNSVKKAVLCPFHADKNPSMFLSDEKGLFHCFSCKASGDMIKFVQDIEKLPFIEALKKVATLAGIDRARCYLINISISQSNREYLPYHHRYRRGRF